MRVLSVATARSLSPRDRPAVAAPSSMSLWSAGRSGSSPHHADAHRGNQGRGPTCSTASYTAAHLAAAVSAACCRPQRFDPLRVSRSAQVCKRLLPAGVAPLQREHTGGAAIVLRGRGAPDQLARSPAALSGHLPQHDGEAL
eukprot:CAMPEP_0181177842 /NCGR_PEP_ID=MMETSP1096-20121128/5390_1 /TAXON_ID=156174 ORGANISM="Chrysochromulina ericina, Strain CCMP281" /NCGR_SAMPLE_ID=MMETSP1096 /ASSEMBLY_ACC=CAM_ASM_000453 /LENGTH=141 /DNA_ID=CAMNT_0023266047 /DNA_START=153 /DNA_END=579 /DNA_ORIENTATION=+